MTYTLTFAFLAFFRILAEVGANFEIAQHVIFITAVDDATRTVSYAAVEVTV